MSGIQVVFNKFFENCNYLIYLNFYWILGNPDADNDTNFPPRRSSRLRNQQANKSQETDKSNTEETKEWTFDKLKDYDPDTDRYLVQWTNYGPEHDSWQPPCDVPYNAVRSLHKRKKWRVPAYKPGKYLD